MCCLSLAPQCISALLRRGVSLPIPLLSGCHGSSLSLSRRSWVGWTYRQSRVLARGASDRPRLTVPTVQYTVRTQWCRAGCSQELQTVKVFLLLIAMVSSKLRVRLRLGLVAENLLSMSKGKE